jgi:hypothetical protein
VEVVDLTTTSTTGSEGAGRTGRPERAGAERGTSLSSGVVERPGDRRVVVLVVGAVLLLIAGFVVGRSDGNDGTATAPTAASASTSPGGAAGATNRDGSSTATDPTDGSDPSARRSGGTRPTRRRSGPGTSVAGTLPSGEPVMRAVEVVPAALACGQVDPAGPLPAGIPEPGTTLSEPLAVDGALIPGSRSVAFEPADTWSLAPVPGGTSGEVIATINIAGLSITSIGSFAPPSFDAQVTLAGCVAEQPLVTSTNHLWVLLHSINQTYVVDLDRTTRSVAWSARCDGCELVRQGTDGQVWVLGWQGSQGERRQPAGSLVLHAIDVDDHEIHGPVMLGEDGLPADVAGRLVVVRSSIRLVVVNPTDGSTIAMAPANARAGVRDAPGVFGAGGLIWSLEDDSRLVGRAPTDLSVVTSIEAPDVAAIAHGGDQIWFQAITGDDQHDLELVHVDASSRTVVSRRTFRSFRQFQTGVGPALHTPELIVDAKGFWYAEPLPLPPDATLDGSTPVSGPYHLFRFDGV